MGKGCFITFEGIDGAGKSTQLAWVKELLVNRGIAVTVTREPGGTSLGERLREILLHSEDAVLPETEALLMFAARREHIDKVITPALARGEVVLCDRFTDATIAYQGGGSGVSIAKLESLERWVQGDLQPDLTLYFDLPVEVAKERINDPRRQDRFERETDGFFERVRFAYLARARAQPQRIRVIDANVRPAVINKKLEDIISSICL
ncbi:MAG: dTMP kinase [Betaproteobacteria bacterium]|nr:MAG: dTMP kinase [Betaproteobacteria bacterium]